MTINMPDGTAVDSPQEISPALRELFARAAYQDFYDTLNADPDMGAVAEWLSLDEIYQDGFTAAAMRVIQMIYDHMPVPPPIIYPDDPGGDD